MNTVSPATTLCSALSWVPQRVVLLLRCCHGLSELLRQRFLRHRVGVRGWLLGEFCWSGFLPSRFRTSLQLHVLVVVVEHYLRRVDLALCRNLLHDLSSSADRLGLLRRYRYLCRRVRIDRCLQDRHKLLDDLRDIVDRCRLPRARLFALSNSVCASRRLTMVLAPSLQRHRPPLLPSWRFARVAPLQPAHSVLVSG